jgi:hypothetical protein
VGGYRRPPAHQELQMPVLPVCACVSCPVHDASLPAAPSPRCAVNPSSSACRVTAESIPRPRGAGTVPKGPRPALSRPPGGKRRWRVEGLELDPGCGEHDVTYEVDDGRLAARQVRGLVPLDRQRTALGRMVLDRWNDQATSTVSGAIAGSVRATSRTRDDAPGRSPTSRATATRNPGDRPANPAARAVSSPPSSPDAPVRTHTVSPSTTPPRTIQPPARTSTRICRPDASVVTSTRPAMVRPSGASTCAL